MLTAIELSEIAYQSVKGLPIGCVIGRNGEIRIMYKTCGVEEK